MFLFGELIKSPFIHLLANYSSSNHLTLHPSIPLVSYFYAIHLFGELTFHPSIPLASYLVIFVSFIPWASYFRADHLILHPLASYFSVYHVTLHPSIPLASYFCAIHSLGKLFSCRPFNSPSFGEFFLCRPYNVHRFGELFLCLPSLGRVIFVPTIQLSYPSISLASYFCVSPFLGRVIFVPTI